MVSKPQWRDFQNLDRSLAPSTSSYNVTIENKRNALRAQIHKKLSLQITINKHFPILFANTVGRSVVRMSSS